MNLSNSLGEISARSKKILWTTSDELLDKALSDPPHTMAQQMSSPIQFYRSFQTLMREHDIRHVLTLNMACCEYGIQQPTKDTDWIVHPDDLGKLLDLLYQCERGLTGENWRISYRSLFGAPFLEDYHRGGWTTHIAIHDEANSPEHHLDFFGKAPRVRLEDVFDGSSEGLAGRGVIAQMKKTDRDKDWPMVEALSWQMENDWNSLLHMRTPERMMDLWKKCPQHIQSTLIIKRPLLKTLETCEINLTKALAIERLIWEQVNKQRYRRYQHEWRDFLRRWKTEPAMAWPVTIPFLQQHDLLTSAVTKHNLPTDPLGGSTGRHALLISAWVSVAEIFDGQQKTIELLTPPIELLLA